MRAPILALGLVCAVALHGCGPADARPPSFSPTVAAAGAAGGVPDWTEWDCPVIGDFFGTSLVTAVSDSANVCTFTLDYTTAITTPSAANRIHFISMDLGSEFDPYTQILQFQLSDITPPDNRAGDPWLAMVADAGSCYGGGSSAVNGIVFDASTGFASENTQTIALTPVTSFSAEPDSYIFTVTPNHEGTFLSFRGYNSGGSSVGGDEIYSGNAPQDSQYAGAYNTDWCVWFAFGQKTADTGTGSVAFKTSWRVVTVREI